MVGAKRSAQGRAPPRPPQPEPRIRSGGCVIVVFVPPCFRLSFKETTAGDVCVAAKHPSPSVRPACVSVPPGKGGCISTFCKGLSKTALAAGNGFSSQQIASPPAPSQQRWLLEQAPGTLPGDCSEPGGSSRDASRRAPAALLCAWGWLGHSASPSCWDLSFPGPWWGSARFLWPAALRLNPQPQP